MIDFEYYRPVVLEDAITLSSKYGERARILAGGTELINEIRSGKAKPEQIIDVKDIPDMNIIEQTPEGLRLGALVRVRDIETSRVIQSSFPALSYAAGALGSVQVRNKATIGGNICRASPSADMVPPLTALGSVLKISGAAGEKKVLLEEFVLGPGKTILKPGEILTEIFVPALPVKSACSYIKLSPRRSMDLAVVGVAVMLETTSSVSECIDARIVLGAVAPTAIRARNAEVILIGNRFTDAIIERSAQTAAAEAKPVDDIRASEWYRRKMIEVLVRRSIGLSLQQIKSTRRL
jgi:carbon-monoxide dehydrogenase medium subunit